ncbi:Rrf2 family transcriptional regulator [Priestia aryabhattai]|uniref:Rrf2 family transcriptional regulator n=1 Tax=Priestia TaxID=2800373 RepID=UPI0008DE1733|nr:Rrf2 family transcriptional regulator [Priestia aryabhattai]MBZ6487086.1 Rrf2 family transcriptional regulator [Priestia aryabhattai]MDH3113938.1 Rrf2 family transcriptional regulator [Priestia aryabhattai]MDH3127159.1 Rrf2 family transcriptional regulator [Priestia aryabhattai]MDH3132601.1 Rrf2 family transcriptional regulator [Priestia aryabhattai]MED4153435.1 Rrf2 family transcriptional regulator [Priestia aryabhattai]
MNSEFTIAVHSLVFLANLPDHRASSESIAYNICTNPARVRKIMSTLRKNNLVRTKEGLGGGYTLGCSPAEISLGLIYRVISTGTLKPHWCSGDPDADCIVKSNIQTVMDDIFTESEQSVIRHLDQITIEDVLKKVRAAH